MSSNSNNAGRVRIACIGEAMVELSFPRGNTAQAQVGFAGDTLNTAIYLKRCMGENADVSYVTVLGEDQFSQSMVEFMQDEELNTDSISRHPTRMPGLYAINTDDHGERSFSYWRDTSAAKTLFQSDDGFDFDGLANYDLLYFSAITMAILPSETREAFLSRIVNLRRTGTQIAFDSNYRPRLWKSREEAQLWTERCWRACDIALPSVDDETDLFADQTEADVLSRLSSYGCATGALKRGPEGPKALDGSPSPEPFSAVKKLIDSTAAGDSFNAGFLAGFLKTSDQHHAMQTGHNLAAKVVQHRGAIIPRDAD